MSTTSFILLPPPELASCMSLAIGRDTRGADLCDADRLSYFPASPLVAFTVVLHGQLRISLELCDLAAIRTKAVMPAVSATPPQVKPTVSWCDGPVQAITLGFYPDAWSLLGGDVGAGTPPADLVKAASVFAQGQDMAAAWSQFCQALEPLWIDARAANQTPYWAGSDKVADWTRHLVTRAALSGVGQSVRSFERRMKRWTGQSRQALATFAQLEDLHSLHMHEPEAGLAEIAADAQFSDQSHMGRAVKKITGFPPGRLSQLIETQEAFWCYRLLGERL